MKSRSFIYIGVIVAVLVAGGFASLRLTRPEAQVAVVKRGTAVSALPANVAVRADYSMELRSESGGRVVDSSLVLGRSVKAGELLLKIDDTDLKLELERVTNDYDAALKRRAVGSATKLDLETAKADLANFTRLAEGGQYSSTELDKRKREVRALEQKLEIEQINEESLITGLATDIKTRKRQIEKTSLFSPIDADVTSVSAYVGDLIVSSAPLAILLARERLVEARVSEENFSGIVIGQRAQVRFLGYGDEQFTGTVARVLPTADPLTQRYTVILDVKIPPARLVPGLSGEASIIVGQRADVMIIPRRALLGDYVLAVRDGRVKQLRVTRGYESLNEVEIVSGLSEGDLVITDNLDAYRENDRVRVVKPAKR
ncbi:efflux RND transporter periplasmic adaptor subunit [Rariglobus hedericola]|uniref:Efflux RND transporter periplasmic adaptor subunit n=1 Tax=Rariglobus hedericola TaxID=2597822 RepID=A0A556QJ42_9BACT|nr:efflux RND transporter periplasmic adaptor subunit [Rariglobus hedericola]TSJ76675.1 efflux RND transporter periplasmic adaptor subunit [Rariglobus hedericola]